MSTLDEPPQPTSPAYYYPTSPAAYYPPSPPAYYYHTSPVYSPPLSSPGSSARWYSPPPSAPPVYCAVPVYAPTSPGYSPDEWWGDHTTSPSSPGSPVYCNTRTSRPIHGNRSTTTASSCITGPAGYCATREFNDQACPALLVSPAYDSPTSPGHFPEEFNDVWGDITLAADKVQTPASLEYCYCCSTTLQDCCCQASDDAALAP
ncbi:hypothetical protein SORBI_3002G266500 [Sorghum bicolor]|uniref:Uncharacterized protein n=1 Tax=Sorghum bicolor TaxID=4558 RepID=A0A1W0W5Y1_SORBI|nr:hypothetical protein SORBI_3002G266500 [Sorghum bicolor]